MNQGTDYPHHGERLRIPAILESHTLNLPAISIDDLRWILGMRIVESMAQIRYTCSSKGVCAVVDSFVKARSVVVEG